MPDPRAYSGRDPAKDHKWRVNLPGFKATFPTFAQALLETQSMFDVEASPKGAVIAFERIAEADVRPVSPTDALFPDATKGDPNG